MSRGKASNLSWTGDGACQRAQPRLQLQTQAEERETALNARQEPKGCGIQGLQSVVDIG